MGKKVSNVAAPAVSLTSFAASGIQYWLPGALPDEITAMTPSFLAGVGILAAAIWIGAQWRQLENGDQFFQRKFAAWKKSVEFSDLIFRNTLSETRNRISHVELRILKPCVNALVTVEIHFDFRTQTDSQWRQIGRATIGPRQRLNVGDILVVPLLARPKGDLRPPYPHHPSLAVDPGRYKAVVTLTSDRAPMTEEYQIWVSRGSVDIMQPIPMVFAEHTLPPWNDGCVAYEVIYDR